MSAPKWIDDVKRVAITHVFNAIGMSERKRTWGPCPACKATQRGSEDGRGPVGVNAYGGWACHAGSCGAKGDAVTALAYHLTGSDSPRDGNWDAIRDYAAEHGWCQKGREVTDRVRHVSGAAHAPTPPAPPTSQPDEDDDGDPDLGPGSPTSSYKPDTAKRTDRTDRAKGDQQAEPDEQDSAPAKGMFKWSSDLIDRCWAAYQDPAVFVRDGAWSESDVTLAISLVQYLVEYRCLTDDVIRFAKLGIYVDTDGKLILDGGRPWLVIPLYDKAGRAVSAHFRRVPVPGTCDDCDAIGKWKECETCRKKKRYRLCPGRPTPLYGANHLTGDTRKPVYIVEGELDVLALRAYGYTENVVSGTAGADTFVSKQDWLDAIEPYESFYLCYDDDKAGNDGAAALGAKLGADRCSRVRFPHKDVGDCLIQRVPDEQIRRAFQTAESLVEIKFRKASGFIEQIKAITNEPNMGRGTPTGSDILDAAIAGWRPGVVVVTGDTGAGKTTWLTWSLWNLATRGYPVAITSFEQTPAGSVQKVLRMQLGGDYTKVPEAEIDRAGAELDAMPLYFVDHYGHLPFAKLQESLKYAARRLGIKHILVDHLGFLVDEESEDERRAIEAIVRSMVIIAKNLGITIFLVVHPRNDPDAKTFSRVTMRHLKGASAIRQDADDVLVVTSEPPNTERGRMLPKGKRRPWPQMRLFIDKKRSEFGTIPPGGCIVMAFDPVSLRYADSWSETPLGRSGVMFDTTPETGQEGDKEHAPKGGKRKGATGGRKGGRRDSGSEPDDADPFTTDV